VAPFDFLFVRVNHFLVFLNPSSVVGLFGLFDVFSKVLNLSFELSDQFIELCFSILIILSKLLFAPLDLLFINLNEFQVLLNPSCVTSFLSLVNVLFEPLNLGLELADPFEELFFRELFITTAGELLQAPYNFFLVLSDFRLVLFGLRPILNF